MAKQNFENLEDLFSEENILKTQEINNAQYDNNFENEISTPLIIKIRKDEEIKTTYGYEYKGSHLKIFESLREPDNIYQFNIEELKRSINIKNLLKDRFDFNGNLKSNDFANHLIEKYNIDVEKAYLSQYIYKQLEEPDDKSIGISMFGKRYVSTSELGSEVVKKISDKVGYIAFNKFINQFNKIENFIKNGEVFNNQEHEVLKQSKLLSQVKEVMKKRTTKANDISTYVLANLFNHAIKFEQEKLLINLNNNFDTETKTKMINLTMLEQYNSVLNYCSSLIKNNSSTRNQSIAEDLISLQKKVSILADVSNEEKSIDLMFNKFMDEEAFSLGINLFKGDLLCLSETHYKEAISEYYKELYGKDKPILENCFKYFDFINKYSKVEPENPNEEKTKIFVLEKKRRCAEIKKLPSYSIIEAKNWKEAIDKLENQWKIFIEKELFIPKAKVVKAFKSTNNKLLNKDLFVAKYPELKQVVDEVYGRKIDFSTEKPEKILENVGARGLEFGKTLKNKENVLFNIIACSALMSKALNININDLFLNGSLGVAIGSRGRGQALAHFETNNNLIHVTQKNNLESFVHEMAHALDAALAAYINKDLSYNDMNYPKPTTKYSMDRNYLLIDPSEFNENNKNTKEILDIISKLRTSFRDSDMYEGAKKLEGGKRDSYWTTHIEMFARSVESFVYDKLNDMGLPVNVGTHISYNAEQYLSSKDKEKIYPILNDFFNKFSEISPEIAKRRSEIILKKDLNYGEQNVEL